MHIDVDIFDSLLFMCLPVQPHSTALFKASHFNANRLMCFVHAALQRRATTSHMYSLVQGSSNIILEISLVL